MISTARHITLIGWADCGCASLLVHVDPDDKKKLAWFHRIAKTRQLTIEQPDADSLQSKVFECPEHRSLRLRAIERGRAKRAVEHCETPGGALPEGGAR